MDCCPTGDKRDVSSRCVRVTLRFRVLETSGYEEPLECLVNIVISHFNVQSVDTMASGTRICND